MMEFGETLRTAREAKGLTIAQISDLTRLLPQQIEDLENENFSRIAAPIYGRGFVKLYCGAVGIDPKPLVTEFMDIYSGNKQPTIKFKKPVRHVEQNEAESAKQPATPQPPPPPAQEQPVVEEAKAEPPPPQPSPQPAPAPAPAPVASETSYEDDGIRRAASFDIPPLPTQDSFKMDEPVQQLQPPPQPQPVAAPPPPPRDPYETISARSPYSQSAYKESPAEAMKRAVAAQPPPPQPFTLEQEVVSQPQPLAQPDSRSQNFATSRYGTPLPSPSQSNRYSDFYIPPAFWRVCILIAGIALVIWLIVALGSKLWRTATVAPAEPPAAETTSIPPQNAQNPSENALSSPSDASTPAKERTPVKLPPLYFE